MPLALVTGPTSGIGRAFAQALGKLGHDLILVSRDEERLRSTARELQSASGVSATVVTADLSRRNDMDRVASLAAERDLDVLVNNAGFGLRGSFLHTSVTEEQHMLDVLVTSVMRISHAVVPGMVERGRGHIYTVSSVAGWITGGTYSAAKAWATVFTEGLSAQLSNTGVGATAVCPGFTHTEFHDRAGMNMGKVSGWMWLDADDVVDRALKDGAAGRTLSVAGARYRALASFLRVAPRGLIRRATGDRRKASRFDVNPDETSNVIDE